MPKSHLASYVHDHLAGSTAALELIERLAKAHKDTPLAAFFATLHGEVAADQQELERLITQLDAGESPVRQASAWLGEKFAQVKLLLDDPVDGELRMLESLEALVLGIEGKAGLWRALAATQDHNPGLRGFDYARLIQRAEDQQRQVEAERLAAAKRAFAAP